MCAHRSSCKKDATHIWEVKQEWINILARSDRQFLMKEGP